MSKRKKLIKFTISLLLSGLVLLSVFPVVYAEEATPDEKPREKAQITVTADEIAESSFSKAVQNALHTARENSEKNISTEVQVEPGDYELDRGLRIYSDTTLTLYGVNIKRAQGAYVNMLRIGSEDSVNKGVTGYYYKNIALNGGVFDADNTVQTMIKAAHAKNFAMTDVTLKNVKNSHMMEVAGVDGFFVKNCVFDSQILDRETSDEVCYEAVQLDVLKAGHIVNCRSEDLGMKNILFEGCSFKNMPRAIGSHTAILNNPLDGIVIKNNSFVDMESAAVQTLGWINCTITDNYIKHCSRAIAVYATGTDGKGTFLPSVLANEGETEAHFSDLYKEPIDSNTVIENNTIIDCGSVEDTLGNYTVSAVSVIGYNLAEVLPYGNTGSAGLPIGNYFATGVKIRNNYIQVKGTAVRIADARNVEVDSNMLYCEDSTLHPDDNYYGVVVRYGSRVTSVNNNYIKNAKTNGIHFGEECENASVTNNKISTTRKHGIVFYNTKVNNLENNEIDNAKVEGIGLKTGSDIKSTISGNRISNCETGIYLTTASKGFMSSNTAVNCGTPYKFVKQELKNVYANNYTEGSASSAVYTDVSSVELFAGRSYKLQTKTVPVNCNSAVSYTSSDSDIVSTGDDGYISALNEGEAVVTAKTSDGKTAEVKVTVKNENTETKTTASPAVTGISTLYNKTDGVYLKWNKVNGADKYRVYRKTTGSYGRVEETASLSCTDKKAVSGTDYSYTVRALDKSGNFIGSYDTEGCKIRYVAAASVTTISNTKDSVKFEWDKVKGADKYRLFCKVGNSAWTHLSTTAKNSKNYKPVKSGESYSLAIVSLDKNKDPLNMYKTSASGKFLSKTSLKLVKRAKSGKKIRLSWNKVNGAKKYVLNVLKTKKKVKVYDKKKKKNVIKYYDNIFWKRKKPTTSTSAVLNGTPGITYKYTIKSMDESGKYTSVDSDIKTVKFKKAKVKKDTAKKKKNR